MTRSKTLAIIPARGGSKRLPRKNIIPLKGIPLICWTIESALKSEEFDKIIVSSDDTEILEIAGKYEISSNPSHIFLILLSFKVSLSMNEGVKFFFLAFSRSNLFELRF